MKQQATLGQPKRTHQEGFDVVLSRQWRSEAGSALRNEPRDQKTVATGEQTKGEAVTLKNRALAYAQRQPNR